MTRTFLEPTEAQAIELLSRGIEGAVVMLNLLRFRDVADYGDLEPHRVISGAEAFDRYVAETTPLLVSKGGEVVFSGRASTFFIGPEAERWDRAMLVRQPSVSVFLAWARDLGYMKGALAHRRAALADSRLLPLVENG